MKIRSQIDVSGVADLVKEMFEQSELYDIVKYYKPYFSVKRIDSGEEIPQGYYEEPEEILSKPGQVFPSDRGYGDIENNHNTLTKEEALDKIREKIEKQQYIKLSVARYALTDVIEELHKSNAKDIIVTKEDDGLVVKYKPYWKE